MDNLWKRIILLIVFGVLLSLVNARADIYIVYDQASKDVVSISKRDDVVMEPAWKLKVLPGRFEDLQLVEHPTYYKLQGNRLVLNTRKVSDEEIERNNQRDRSADILSIKNRLYRDACIKMETEGYNFTRIECNDF